MIWARGFRPFFLLAASFAAALVPLWVAVLVGWVPAPGWLAPSLWHGHEMLFGFVVAATAGFLLTAVPVWTQTPPLRGVPLALLAGLWVAGRVAMWRPEGLPPGAVAAVDLAFLPALGCALAAPLWRARQLRNLGMVGILAGLFLANLVIHLQALGHGELARPALRFAVDLVILLIVVIGGRIVPAFTRNALTRAGIPARVRARPWLDRLSIGSVLAVVAGQVLLPPGVARGFLAALAASAVAARLSGWQGLRTARDPLLWSLHLGMAWVAVGLAASAVSQLGGPIPETVALHALTAGAMGAMILSVMARVSLGHTGRPLVVPRGIPAAFLLVNAGALVRTLGPVLLPAHFVDEMVLSGLLWSSAFALFLLRYGWILWAPRSDGSPG